MLNAVVDSRRRLCSSRMNGTTGTSRARPIPVAISGGLNFAAVAGPAATAATSAATGSEMPSPAIPSAWSPTRRVNRMYPA